MSEHIGTGTMAILPLTTVGANNLTVNVIHGAADEPGVIDWGIGVYVDGAFVTSLVPTVAGLNVFTVALGGGTHTVDLWNSLTVRHRGAFVYSYSADTGTVSVRTLPPATRRMVFYTDSIGVGEVATPATQKAFIAQLRGVYPGRIAIFGWGWHALFDDSGSFTAAGLPGNGGFPSFAACAAAMVAYLKQDNPATREVMLLIGINDATLQLSDSLLGYWSSTAFGAAYGQFLDAIHAADPGVRIYAISPIITTQEATANRFGEFPPAYRTQVLAQAASRSSFVTAVDGTTLVKPSGIDAFHLHPTNTGHQAIFNNTGPDANGNSLRLVLGV